ncbi:hypothetical protein Tco_0968304 [Tanacetum coccineum]
MPDSLSIPFPPRFHSERSDIGFTMNVMSLNIQGLGHTSKKVSGIRPSVGLSGGILCVWNPNVFAKESVTVMRLKDISAREIFAGITLFHYDLICGMENVSFLEISMKLDRRTRDLVLFSTILVIQALMHLYLSSCLIVFPLEGAHLSYMESSVDFGPSPLYFSSEKEVQALKAIIKNWSRDEMLKASAVRHSAQSRISELDKLIDKGLSKQRYFNERSPFEKIFMILICDNYSVWPKRQDQWAIEGDENSKYFHGIINKKRSQLAISCVCRWRGGWKRSSQSEE